MPETDSKINVQAKQHLESYLTSKMIREGAPCKNHFPKTLQYG